MCGMRSQNKQNLLQIVKNNLILFFMLHLELFVLLGIFVLFSRENNQKRRMEKLKILVFEVSYLKTNVFAFDRLKDMF